MHDETERARGALRSLEARLRQARESRRAARAPGPTGAAAAPGLGAALRIGVEMVVGVGVGAAIGYGLDRWWGTAPIMTVLFFFLGAGAGALNTHRAIARAGFGRSGRGNGETG